MKVLYYILLILIVTLFSIRLVNATTSVEDAYTDKYKPEERWNIIRNSLTTGLETSKDEKFQYFNRLYCDLLLIPGFLHQANNQFPQNLAQIYPSKGFFRKLYNTEHFLFKPQKLLNPFTGQLTKEVDLYHVSSGDVTLFTESCFNRVDRILAIIWNEQVDDEDVRWLRLIQENGSLIAFCQPHPGDDAISGIDLEDLFHNSISYAFFNFTIYGTGIYNTSWQGLNDRANANLSGGFCGEGSIKDEPVSKNIITDIINKSNIQNPALKPAERWVEVKDELLKHLTPEEQDTIKKTTDNYFFTINTAFHQVLPELIKTNTEILANPFEVFDKEITIAKTPILIELPKNPYTRKPLATTPLDKPYPGAVTCLSDKTATGKHRTMILVWNYRLDADDMKWLLLFESNGGLMNFCWSKTNDNWKLSPNLFTTLFPSVKSVHFYYD